MTFFHFNSRPLRAIKYLSAISNALIFCVLLFPHPRVATASSSDDLRDIDFLVTAIRENYAGFADKMTPAMEPQLATATEQLRIKAGRASDLELLQLMRAWTEIFHDSRLRIIFSGSHQTEFAQQGAKEAERRPEVTEEFTRAYLKDNKASLDPIEGIWTNLDDSTRFALIRDTPVSFIAVTLKAKDENWETGFVKAHFEAPKNGAYAALFYGSSFLRYRMQGRLLAEGSVLKLGGYWKRVFPPPDLDVDLERYIPGKEFVLHSLSNETLLIRLPDFYENHLPGLQRLFIENADLINRTPNWVIDLRSSEGGSDFVYDTLIDYLYTRPFYQIDYQFLATAENIDFLNGILQTPSLPERQKKQLEVLLGRMRQHKNQFVTLTDKQFSITTRLNVSPWPKKVGIIITGAVGSAEKFVLAARQSRKVTLFGGYTAGALDYLNTNKLTLPSGRFELFYPISRSLRLPEEPLDYIGIPPDVTIPENEPDPIGYVRKELESGGR